MDNRLDQDALIEEALTSQPLVPMPRSVTANVISRIQKDARPSLITWNDFVLGLVIVLSIGALFFAVQNLPPMLVAKIRVQGILFYQAILVNARWLMPVLPFALAAIFSAMAIPYLQRELRNNQ